MKHDIAKELMYQCQADYVKVIDDSKKHAGHRGTDKAENSHFSVEIISDIFKGKNTVARHKMIYSVLDLEKRGIHALAIRAKTPEEVA